MVAPEFVLAAPRDSLDALTAASKATTTSIQPDGILQKLEEQIFEQHAAATAYDDEMIRLQDIWLTESKRLYLDSIIGRCTLTEKERWDRVSAMPEAKEHARLGELQRVHDAEMDKLISQMWATPSHTPEGLRSKLLVLLGCILTDDWRHVDENTEYDVRRARDLMIEFVGGEPSEQMRDKFA